MKGLPPFAEEMVNDAMRKGLMVGFGAGFVFGVGITVFAALIAATVVTVVI